jgi:phage tail sheath protein FI
MKDSLNYFQLDKVDVIKYAGGIMPQYLTPGVFIEEIEIGAKPIEGVSTNVAGFLGATERGPLAASFITSFDQFKKLYGGYIDGSYLAYAIDGYFRNGGAGCFVARILGDESIKSLITLNGAFTVKAIGEGTWGDKLALTVEKAGLEDLNKVLFKLKLFYNDKLVEEYDNLSPLNQSGDFSEKRINGISNYVTVAQLEGKRPENTKANETVKLQGGKDGKTVSPTDYDGRELKEDSKGTGKYTGLMAFDRISEISLVCAPNENDSVFVNQVAEKLVIHCEKRKDRFAILQAGSDKKEIADLNPSVRSKYAAYYYPWIQILDPVTNMSKYVPPGGHVTGIYARTDTERGVHKAPANTPVNGALGLKFDVADAEQAILNPKGVNCIRTFSGRGTLVWGARTSILDSAWKYVNVSRLFIFVEKSIKEGIRWAVFEPNNERLWSRVKQTVDQFLTAVWRTGALMGTTADQAFFVRCDRTTMTQDDIDNGRLVVLVGIAPTKPAEFVIFRIAQVAKGSDISEA